ncbi:MAG: hypothetical protein ABI769_02175 [Pseudomonadota bacterium]
MHRPAERSFRHVRRGAFDDVDALDHRGRQFAQVCRAAPGAGASAKRQRAVGVQNAHAIDVDARGLRSVAAHRDALALAIFAAIERNAGHAGNCFINVLIGEAADIFGSDGIGRRFCDLFPVDRRALRLARALDDNFVQFGRVSGRRGRCRIDVLCRGEWCGTQ